MARTAPIRAALATLLSSCLVLLAACSGEDAEQPQGEGPTGATAVKEVTVRVSQGEVVGSLAEKPRKRAVADVGDVVEGWLRAAYPPEGERTDVAASLGGFTTDAARQARRAKGVWAAGATPVRASVEVDVLAPQRRVSGATARVSVLLEDEDGARQRVTGRLLLTPVKRGWRVFGFDLERGAAGTPAARKGEESGGKSSKNKKESSKKKDGKRKNAEKKNEKQGGQR